MEADIFSFLGLFKLYLDQLYEKNIEIHETAMTLINSFVSVFKDRTDKECSIIVEIEKLIEAFLEQVHA